MESGIMLPPVLWLNEILSSRPEAFYKHAKSVLPGFGIVDSFRF